jgi:16S rRNA (uracil1498-N3)-methyltransferase
MPVSARLYVDLDLAAGQAVALPDGVARHVQVLRLQPGQEVVLFNGRGGEWRAAIRHIGRRGVEVQVLDHQAADREPALPVTLAVGMPANDRFDWLIEKATELGVAAIQPLVCERSVARPTAERAERKREHWQAVAVAAAEQCGRTRVPAVAAAQPFALWLQDRPHAGRTPLWMLSLRQAGPLTPALGGLHQAAGLAILSGPEGGLSPTEETAALAAGAAAISLGPRVLRAETAPLVVLAVLGILDR